MNYVHTSKVEITVPRWTTETVNVLDLLVNRIHEIRENVPGEFDLYGPIDEQRGNLFRVGTVTKLTRSDLELFMIDRSKFWEVHVGKVTAGMIREISTIRGLNWAIERYGEPYNTSKAGS